MVNLLPKPTKRKLRFDYTMRLAITGLFTTTLAGVIGVALLIPSYVSVRDKAEENARYLANVKQTTGTEDKTAAGALVLVAERLKIIKDYTRPPSTAVLLTRLEKDLPRDVILDKFVVNYTEAHAGNILISGIAKTRGGLIAYAQALQKDSAFTGVKVPVTQLNLDANIDFSLAFSFVLKP